MRTEFRKLAGLAGLVATLVAITVAGCATQDRIEKLYQDPAASAATFERLLVVGIAADGAQRRQIEQLITENLAREEVAAIAAYTKLGSSPVLLQDAIDQAAAETQSDGILIAHLVSTNVKPEIVEGRVEVRSECRGGNPVDYFLYDHEELREPDTVALAHEVTMVSNLYDARTGKRLWTIQSTCFEKESFDAVLAREARAIVGQLRRDGLIRPPSH